MCFANCRYQPIHNCSSRIRPDQEEHSRHRCPPFSGFLPGPLIFEIDNDSDRIPQSQPHHLLHRIRHCCRKQMRPSLLGQISHDPLYIPPVIRAGQQFVRFVENQTVEIAHFDHTFPSRGQEKACESARGADEDVGGQGEEGVVWIDGTGCDQAGKGVGSGNERRHR